VDAAFKTDAHRQYEHMRDRGSVHRVKLSSGIDGWLIVGYEQAREALIHPALLKDPHPAAETLEAAG
jgi:hypothetical protein